MCFQPSTPAISYNDLPLLGIFLLVFLAGCDASTPSEHGASDPSSDAPPPIPGAFTYETATDVAVTLRTQSTSGTPIASVPLSLFAMRGETEVRVASGVTDADGRFHTLLSLPTTDTHLIARASYVGLPDSVRLPIEHGHIRHTFGTGGANHTKRTQQAISNAVTNAVTGGASSAAASERLDLSFLSPYNRYGLPTNRAEGDAISGNLLSKINNALPEGHPVPEANPGYLASGNETDVVLTEEAEVWVTFVHEGAGFQNTLGFYTYDVDNPPTSPDDIETHTVIFPNVSFIGSGGAMVSGDKMYLGTFPEGTAIGWFLLANGWRDNKVHKGIYTLYSNPAFNDVDDDTKQQHTVLLNAPEDDLVLLGFEDMQRNRGSDEDFNDAVFYVTSNPIEAIDRSSMPDADTDGPENNETGTPQTTYQPGEGQFASLVFEDLWPAEGDYDFNDMVIDYNVATQVQNGDVQSLTATFVTRAAGASFANGFGFALPVDPEEVANVTGTDLREGLVTTNANGTEAGTDRAVVVAYDNVHNRVQRAGGFFNTQPDVTYMPPDTIQVTVAFTAGVSQDALGTAPYDPFIFVNGDRSREVHLPDQAPTALASPEWFGQSQDTSDPDADRYYKTANNRPWALHVPSSFAYPTEQADIQDAYRHFQDWAESGGTAYLDWYSNTSAAYRTESLLYARP